ncbi:precorrin-6y C5,15-methyltransferase (decarboxylating) subunit CbiE [Zoogloea sp.]|uniref:precorrin-6y C5,15-methyltransferase (decarboxylating) subunit CbiE n=1 Tax=Zoogloea sp. TaxID=49181 RepID=UPI00258BFAF4|nr:precorrin-6y C5,15-methyltransferase (decarboxylating) subunit CbiE [Zoogloea sp.]MDD2669200.1 precorrin-6y C5,15-methyltransferase (decarboxylating) subunit CbiE [Zoogloea sp.]
MNSPEPCALIGILDDGWSGLGDTARARLLEADLVIGAQRTLDLIAACRPSRVEQRTMDGQLGRVPEWIRTAREAGRSVAVLATGDPLCHGIGSFLVGKLGPDAIDILPAASTLQLAFARLKKSWPAAKVVSVHSRDAGEWLTGATPDHGLYPLVRAAAEHTLIGAFTSPENSPDRIARALVTAGHGDDFRLSVAARLALPDEALFIDLPLTDAAAMHFPDPNIVVLERLAPPQHRATFGFEDADFVQRAPEKGLITKQEARALSLAKLRLRPDSLVWDIGAGSGSVGLEAARLARNGHVWAIEKNPGDAANARENAQRLRASNYTLIEGKAPASLDTWPDPDAVFIGGSGGELAELVRLILARLAPGGRLVMNFVTLENLATATAALNEAGAAWDVVQLQAARSQPILDMHRLAAQNPVWIVSATKESP